MNLARRSSALRKIEGMGLGASVRDQDEGYLASMWSSARIPFYFLQEVLDIARLLLAELEKEPGGEIEEKTGKLEQLKSVLEM